MRAWEEAWAKKQRADELYAGLSSSRRSSFVGNAVRHRGLDWYLQTESGSDRAFYDESTDILKYTDVEIEGYNGPTKVWGIDQDGNATFANMGASPADLNVDSLEVGTGGITVDDGDLVVRDGSTEVFKVDESEQKAIARSLEIGSGTALRKLDAFYVGSQVLTWTNESFRNYSVSLTGRGFSARPDIVFLTAFAADDGGDFTKVILTYTRESSDSSSIHISGETTDGSDISGDIGCSVLAISHS